MSRRFYALFPLLLMVAAFVGPAEAGRPGRWEVVAAGPNAPAVSQELGVARTADGVLNVAWREAFSDVRIRAVTPAGVLGGVASIVTGWSLGADPTLLAQPGVLRAFYGTILPIEGLQTSTATSAVGPWSAPTVVELSEFAPRRTPGVTAAPDGTPIQTWYTAGDIVVHRGLAPGSLHPLTAGGTNARPDIVTDARGSVFVAWCEFTGAVRGVFVRRVDAASGAPAGAAVKLPGSTTDALGAPQASCVLESSVSRREPIAARVGGGVYVAGTSGYPSLNRVLVWRLDGAGNVTSTIVAASGANVSYAEPAIAAAPDGRIWVAWLEPAGAGKRLVARRSNRAGTALGAPVRVAAPGSVGTVNLSAQRDRVDVLAIIQGTGAGSLQHTQLLPALTLVRRGLVRRGRGAAAVTFAVLDAGEPVAGASVRAGSRRGVTGASGTVTLNVRRGGVATATRAGYVAASARFSCCR